MLAPWLVLGAMGAAAPPPPFAPPSGSQPVGRWVGSIPGLPNSKLPDAPTLGNGYAGVLLGSSGAELELWLNTNAMWGCTPGPTGPNALPVPALCSRVGLGGVRLAPATGPSGVALGNFSAEQHISSATLLTRQRSAAGSTLETTTVMAPEKNVRPARHCPLSQSTAHTEPTRRCGPR